MDRGEKGILVIPLAERDSRSFGPWLVICRFDRLLATSALCLHLQVANQLLRCRDRARWPTSHLQASAATNDFCFDMLGSMSTRQGQASQIDICRDNQAGSVAHIDSEHPSFLKLYLGRKMRIN